MHAQSTEVQQSSNAWNRRASGSWNLLAWREAATKRMCFARCILDGEERTAISLIQFVPFNNIDVPCAECRVRNAITTWTETRFVCIGRWATNHNQNHLIFDFLCSRRSEFNTFSPSLCHSLACGFSCAVHAFDFEIKIHSKNENRKTLRVCASFVCRNPFNIICRGFFRLSLCSESETKCSRCSNDSFCWFTFDGPMQTFGGVVWFAVTHFFAGFCCCRCKPSSMN